MKISKSLFVVAAASAFVTAAPVLADEAQVSSGWRQVAYSCESGEALNVAFRESGTAAQVTTADKPAVKLMGRPAKSGFRYSDSRYQLRGEGDQVTWKVGSRTAVKCSSDGQADTTLAAAITS